MSSFISPKKQSMSTYPSVTKYMATRLITFTPDTDIREAMDIPIKKKISGAPVLDEHKQLVGMLSEVDCLKTILEGLYHKKPSQKGTVEDFMSKSVKTINASKNILDAASEFVHAGYKRLPVIEDGKLVGQISRSDILRAIQAIRPTIKHVPDSWKNRPPTMADHKKSRHSANS